MRRIASEQKTLTRVVSPPLYETELKSARKFQHRHDLRGRKGFEPWEAAGEQPMGGCSLGAPTWLGEAVALAWHAPGGALPPPYQWRRLSLRARAPEQHSGTPSRGISTHARFEPWEAVESNRWGDAHSGRPRGLVRLWLWHGTLLGVRHHLRTSGVAFPFVLERLSNTPARPQEASPRTPDVRPCESKRWGDAHSGRPRGLVRLWLWHGTLLGVRHHLRTSGVAFPFVLERLSNTPARPQEASPRTPDLSRGGRVSKRWGDAHSGRPRGLVRLWLWHGTLLGVRYHLRTSGVAFPFVLERLSNTPARPQEASPRTPDLSRGGRVRASDGGTLTRGAHVAR